MAAPVDGWLAVSMSFLLALGCGSAEVQAQKVQRRRDSTWISHLSTLYPCRRAAIEIKPEVNEKNCALAMGALHQIAIGSGVRFGVLKADSANVVAVEVFDRNYGSPAGLYWIVNVAIRGRESGLIVMYERTKQRVTVTHGENWGLPKNQ